MNNKTQQEIAGAISGFAEAWQSIADSLERLTVVVERFNEEWIGVMEQLEPKPKSKKAKSSHKPTSSKPLSRASASTRASTAAQRAKLAKQKKVTG